MGNITIRLGVVIGILAGVQAVFYYVGHGRLTHPDMVEPQQPITNFPMVVSTPETGTWEGKPTKLEDEMFDESEVSVAESRLYTKEGRAMKFFLAEYDQPRAGLYHNPMNCYNSQGFTLVGRAERRPLKAPIAPIPRSA